MRCLALLGFWAVSACAGEPAVPAPPKAHPHARAGHETALDRYLQNDDESFRWSVVKTVPGDGQTTFVLEMTSQTWRTPAEVNRTEWKHWLVIVRPDVVRSTKAMLFIGGGSNERNPPDAADQVAQAMSATTGTVACELKMVPNQPLVFHGDGVKRTEDDLIGYTWDRFMKSGDETWPARLPMVKSAVRAMDAAQAFLATAEGGEQEIDGFVVAGGSKRGWTTWLTGAVDKRVVAIMPIVIDVVNLRISMQHHYGAYGFWAPAVGDYVHHKIVDRSNTPEYAALLAIEDPFSYRDRLELPKYIINAAGDEFFVPDSSQFYFHELPGEKYLRYVPNASHSLKGSDAIESIQAFYQSVLTGQERPSFSWKNADDGSIRVKAEDAPQTVKLWQATNPEARDFRLDTIGPAYTETVLSAEADGTFVGRVERPAKGWTAYFVELTFPSGGPYPFKFTTAVRVSPDVLPFEAEAARMSNAAVGGK